MAHLYTSRWEARRLGGLEARACQRPSFLASKRCELRRLRLLGFSPFLRAETNLFKVLVRPLPPPAEDYPGQAGTTLN